MWGSLAIDKLHKKLSVYHYIVNHFNDLRCFNSVLRPKLKVSLRLSRSKEIKIFVTGKKILLVICDETTKVILDDYGRMCGSSAEAIENWKWWEVRCKKYIFCKPCLLIRLWILRIHRISVPILIALHCSL